MKLPSVPVAYGILSLVCPIFAVCVTLAYQAFDHAAFWDSMSSDESAAGAMMALAEVGQLILATIIGCLVGLVTAIRGMLFQRKVRGFCLVAGVLNILSLALAIFVFFRAFTWR